MNSFNERSKQVKYENLIVGNGVLYQPIVLSDSSRKEQGISLMESIQRRMENITSDKLKVGKNGYNYKSIRPEYFQYILNSVGKDTLLKSGIIVANLLESSEDAIIYLSYFKGMDFCAAINKNTTDTTRMMQPIHQKRKAENYNKMFPVTKEVILLIKDRHVDKIEL